MQLQDQAVPDVMTVPLPSSLESAYREHRNVLYAALGKLAREGFAAPPTDALDLVHDFFLEAWRGLSERYDPQRASLQTYLYAAFVRFARPRIARLQRERASLCDPVELTRMVDIDQQEPELGESLVKTRIGQAIAQLSNADRDLLESWLSAGSGSERQAARELGLSRYQVRQHLVEVLGQLATAVGAVDGRSSVDTRVALAVWGDKLTIGEAAAQIGITVQQARNAYRRNQQRINDTISSVPQARSTTDT